MTLFTDTVQSALERAMDGVAMRQRVTAQNIANVMTPGYRASKVSFEDTLASALSNGTDPSAVSPTVTPEGGPTNELGNDVDLSTESSSLMRSDLQYQALIQAANYRFGVLKQAMA